ncbi:hypothetical protein GT370_11465 [Acidocella sp. MX-AZ03]|nr:hypothetical protein [Acidocella sp. MX-AZ03]WBO57909.1 hypothetical protein GT370_11465 [Acidocella sp. MX-AZ03]
MTMSSLTTRRATPADTDLFLQMCRDFHLEDGSPLDAAGEATIAHICAGEALAPAFLLEHEGAPAGFFVLTLGYSVENGGTDGFIDDIYLIPALRGRGWAGKRWDSPSPRRARLASASCCWRWRRIMNAPTASTEKWASPTPSAACCVR